MILPKPFQTQIQTALENENLQAALDTNAAKRAAARQIAIQTLDQDWETLRRQAHTSRAATIANLDALLNQFSTKVQENGWFIHWAENARQALEIILEIAGQNQAKLVAKSKTMVSEEIGLNHALEQAGLRVVETDLGEYIVQLRNERPAHITTPAVHLRRADVAQTFFVQDSFKQDGPYVEVSYEDLVSQWRAFNNTYIVTYPPEREDEVFSILGAQVDANTNYQAALQKASKESASLTGRDQYFSFFNRGANLVALHDYQNAATAYDAAFANYANIPEDQRPWRILWYQTGPYFAYFYTGRYQDVIDLANETLSNTRLVEESYYWRGMAELALGNNQAAIADFIHSLKVHPSFIPAVEQLNALGVAAK